MKYRLHKNWNTQIDNFTLTQDEIERQAGTDLVNYFRAYFNKYKKTPSEVLDIDNFLEELWGVRVEYGKIEQENGNSTLGYTDPTKSLVFIDYDMCKNDGRINYTLAHEAGHLSLHKSKFIFENGKVVGWRDEPIPPQVKEKLKKKDKTWQLEWQANCYASSLLAPKKKIIDFLNKLGFTNLGGVSSSVDMEVNASILMEHFQMSRQALEIRFQRLGIPMINKKYSD